LGKIIVYGSGLRTSSELYFVFFAGVNMLS